jgi:hypothetical protein
MNRAYRVKRDGREIWGFLDAQKMRDTEHFGPGVYELLKLKHAREAFECPAKSRPDGNHSYAELLAARGDGAAVFGVVYASQSGDRPGQEDVRTFLVYREPAGGWRLAATDLGHEGSLPGSATGSGVHRDMRVTWTKGEMPAPFTVRLTERTSWYGRGEERADRAYVAYRDGVLEAPFPMRPRMEHRQYVIAGGTETLRTVAETMVFFHSGWWDSPWVKSPEEARRRLLDEWTTILQKCNPGLSPDTAVEKGRHIFIPDNEGMISHRMHERLSRLFAKESDGSPKSAPAST